MKVSAGEGYTPAPEGVHEAVCVDVVDLGIVDGMYGAKHKLKIVWEIAEKMEDGRPFTVSQRYTASLADTANLYKHLVSWRGREFTAAELKEFEMDNIIGAPCMLIVKHNSKGGKTYANVSDVLKAKNPITATGKYVRAKDRKDWVDPTEGKTNQPGPAADPDDKDDIPF